MATQPTLKWHQLCCDPRRVKTVAAAKITQSAKLTQWMAKLPEMLAEGRRVLLFPQFTSMHQPDGGGAEKRQNRVGQTHRANPSVWVIRPVALDTIEERILNLQARKAELANKIYSGAANRKQSLFAKADVRELLKPMNWARGLAAVFGPL